MQKCYNLTEKLKKNLWKVSYGMHYSFPNRNFSYSVNFVPDLSNFLESENNAAHYENIFDTKFDEDFFLTLLKTNFFGSKPMLNLFDLNSLQGQLEKLGAKN